MIYEILDQEFISSPSVTEQYKSAKTKFRNALKKLFKDDEIIITSCPHFEFTGFIKRKDKYVYFSTGDLRWRWKCLVRKADHDKDYSGHSNNFVEYNEDFDNNFKSTVERCFSI